MVESEHSKALLRVIVGYVGSEGMATKLAMPPFFLTIRLHHGTGQTGLTRLYSGSAH